MTISEDVQRQFFASTGENNQVIRLPPAPVAAPVGPSRRQGKPWTQEEHERFLQGFEMFPKGPWSAIAAHVGTRTTRQTMTHAQKYRQRISRQAFVQSTQTPDEHQFPWNAVEVGSLNTDADRHFDELDYQILACILPENNEEGSSGDDDDFLGALMDAPHESLEFDEETLRLLAEVNVDEHLA